MLGLLLRRLALAIPLCLGALTLVFVLVESAPGTATDQWLGERPVPPQVRERVERAFGLDRPPLERYLCWLGAVAQGDLGWSHARSRPVSRLLAETLPATLLLSVAALLVQLVFGLGLGVACAAFHERPLDRLLGSGSLLLAALPPFWVALMAILGLSYAVPLFPPAALRSAALPVGSPLAGLLDVAWHLALPAAVLGLSSAATLGRFVRAGVIEALGQDFVRAARARGLGSRRVLLAHALRGALAPVASLTGLSLPVLVSGSLVVEVVFSWPGMGRLTYEAILAKDLPVVLASTLLATLLVVLGSLAADLTLAALDPRVRLTGSAARERA